MNVNGPSSLGRRMVAAVVAIAAAALSLSAHGGDESISMTSGESRTPVVELYTSEGCSSCPPADRWLRQLGRSLDGDFSAVPLAFHVDYWNYLGWIDPYSKPAYTKRQREAPANHRRGIYTPQFLVDGRKARGAAAIIRAIRNANGQRAEATIVAHVSRRGDNADADTITARISVDNRSSGEYIQAHLAIHESGLVRQIGAGENRGKTLLHDFVVRHWSEPIAIRRGANDAEVVLKIPEDWARLNLGLAVVVLNRATGETVQSVNTSLAPLFSD